MNPKEFRELLQHIYDNHSPFFAKGGRTVKYVDPHIDMRTGVCFSITFRLFAGGEYNFNCQNENMDLKESLFDRCMAWLDRKE